MGIMKNLEQFQLSTEDPRFGSEENARKIAAVALFGPAIASEVDGLLREEGELNEREATVNAVHSAVSSLLIREFPDTLERRGLDHALEEFDDGYGMRGGFPTPTSWNYDGRGYYQVMADAVAEGRARHREAMVNSRYTVTLGQAMGTILPFIDAFDDKTKEMFTENFPHYLERAFGNIWGALLDQDSHVEHFSGIMDYIHCAHEHGRARTVPEAVEHDCFNLNFVMTEADVRRMISKPIADAFDNNMTRNGTLRPEAFAA